MHFSGRTRQGDAWWHAARNRHDLALAVGVALLAFFVRLTPVLIGGGLGSYGRYDDGVYYAAADALTFGRVPYRDFVLLHPPGIALVLAPFALLGRATSDPVGMAVGRLAFMAIGALNAALVTVLARRWARRAAVVAGVTYACWLPAVYGEQSTLLEPLGTTALLVALLLLLKTQRDPSPAADALAGAALGLAVTMKIWYLAPWAVVVGWQLVVRRWTSAVRVVAGGTVAAGVVLLPFAILAGRRMFDLVVRDQLLRPQARTSRASRVEDMVGIRGLLPGHHHAAAATTTTIALLIFAAAVVLCLRERNARVLVSLLVVNSLVLIAGPAYFAHYAALIAAPAALVLGVGADQLGQLAPAPLARAFVAVLVVAVAISAVRIVTRPQGHRFSGSAFDRAAPAGCVASDTPEALIHMNRLSSDLAAGCPVPVDVTGITYDAACRVRPNGATLPRRQNAAFQRFLYGYLTSGHSFVVARASGDGLAPQTRQAIEALPMLAQSAGVTLRASPGPGNGLLPLPARATGRVCH